MDKLYFCYTDCFATGEGRHVWLSLESADSITSAAEEHRKRFNFDKYFLVETNIFDVEKEQAQIKEVLFLFFDKDFINNLIQYPRVKNSLFYGFGKDFMFHFYVNRS